jgi:hypothetical protein
MFKRPFSSQRALVEIQFLLAVLVVALVIVILMPLIKIAFVLGLAALVVVLTTPVYRDWKAQRAAARQAPVVP